MTQEWAYKKRGELMSVGSQWAGCDWILYLSNNIVQFWGTLELKEGYGVKEALLLLYLQHNAVLYNIFWYKILKWNPTNSTFFCCLSQ